MGNLIVSDDEFAALADTYKAIGTAAEDKLKRYCDILKTICSNAISDGATFENLRGFLSQAQMMKGQISQLTKAWSSEFSTYVSEVNRADQYLY